MTGKAITLKIVYYGCALGGKTTNLITLHRLTDPDGRQGMVSIATKDDRTLFFDLLPMELGQVAGFALRVKVYTVPGQVHYELTRRQVLAGADGVVLVIDSAPDLQKENLWALENLGFNLKANGLDPDQTPLILQWNKRDLPNARPVADLQAELNPHGLPAHESVATTGAGVAETFAAVLKAAIRITCAKSDRTSIPDEVIDETVDRALEEALAREPSLTEPSQDPAFEHRTDTDAYREEWADKGRDRRILDQEALLGEAVQTGMELAERFDGLRDVQSLNERLGKMVEALREIAVQVIDPSGPSLPDGVMSALLRASGRKRGSILLFRPNESVMDEREVVPEGKDPLNALVVPSVGSAAHRLCQGKTPRHIEDLASEVFFETVPPEAQGIASCLVAPLYCDGVSFGALVVYASMDEPALGAAEREYWGTAATMTGLSLHWRGLRRKLARGEGRAEATTD
jgi:signal recognition particle receptor subunit beta